ncbi:MAG: LLM class flavin-dependent oxidoreductase [Chloroflexi bacterium]|nr:MAG: LLM class flavin-dependent oxidoreductase [Chloroflexota bacterium]
MKLGVFLPSYLLPGQDARHGDQIRRFAVRAEELGFESLFITDHLLTAHRFYRVSWVEPLMTLSHAAAVTSRVMLGTSVLVLPTHNPVVRDRHAPAPFGRPVRLRRRDGLVPAGVRVHWGDDPAARPADGRGAGGFDAAAQGAEPDVRGHIPSVQRHHSRAAGKGAASMGRRRPPARPRGVAGKTADGPPSAPADLQVGRLDRPPDLASRADHRGFEGDRRRADEAEDIAPREGLHSCA